MGKDNIDRPPSDQDDPGEDAGVAVRSRVIVWGESKASRGLFRRLMERLRRDSGGPVEALPPVFRPPVSRRSTSSPTTDAQPSPDVPPASPDVWEPPDLTVELAPTPEAPVAASEASSTPAPGKDHGPGPLSRATLQLLPGRLRPLDPDVIREEIRFVRPMGRDAVVTLGWAEGEPPDHITLNHPSVQDRHARMSFIDGSWRIESLVTSQPVQVNGEPLAAGLEPHRLQSGDEVRLGEARFSFILP